MKTIQALVFSLLVASSAFAACADAKDNDPSPAKTKKTLVARIWRGRVPTSRADEYAKYLYEAGLLKIRGVAGNLGAEMLRRTDGDVTEFVVISYWPDRESIKAFAGADIEKAHFLPRDREFLINPDDFVRHYDVTNAP